MHTGLLTRIRFSLVILMSLGFLWCRWGGGERLLQDTSRKAHRLPSPTASVCREIGLIRPL